MNLVQAAVLGLVEGITEYLPVSSTGHLVIASSVMGLGGAAGIDDFEIVIQGGAILAVLGLYRARVLQMLGGLVGRDPAGLRLLVNVFVAFLPAAAIGLLLHDTIKAHLMHPGPVVGALAVGGLVMIVIGPLLRRSRAAKEDAAPDDTPSGGLDSLTWRGALLVGLLQCLALWPGTSRSMVTIVGGMLVGLRPRAAAEFSFILGLPTLGGACAYAAMKSFRGEGPSFVESLGAGPAIVGIVVATVSAAVAVSWLVAYLNRHGLAVFGWYRLAFAAAYGFLAWKGLAAM